MRWPLGKVSSCGGPILEDAAAGRLQPMYRAEQLHDLNHLPLPRYDLLDLRPYGLIKTFAVQATRGCPMKCSFCSERIYMGDRFRFRPVADVVEEIRHLPSGNVFFAESNFGGNRRHAMELMEAPDSFAPAVVVALVNEPLRRQGVYGFGPTQRSIACQYRHGKPGG